MAAAFCLGADAVFMLPNLSTPKNVCGNISMRSD